MLKIYTTVNCFYKWLWETSCGVPLTICRKCRPMDL